MHSPGTRFFRHIIKNAILICFVLFISLLTNPLRADTSLFSQPSQDFTVVYRVSCDFPLRNTSTGQIRQELLNHYKSASYKLPSGHSASETSLLSDMDEQVADITRQLRGSTKKKHALISISQRGNMLLVRTYYPDTNQQNYLLFNGKNSLYGRTGGVATIRKGLWYPALEYFAFPGRSVNGIDLGRELTASPIPKQTSEADLALSGGVSDVGGTPRIVHGSYITTVVQGVTCLAETHARQNEGEEDTYYSKYSIIAPNLAIPSGIRVELRKKPGHILPVRLISVRSLSLIRSSDKAEPAKNFTPEGQITNSVTVEDMTQTPPRTIRYIPGKSLQEEFEDAEELNSIGAQDTGGHRNSSAFGLLAIIIGISAWFLYRRTSRSRSGEDK